jgi:hypothetical protein
MIAHSIWSDPFGAVLCLVVIWLPVYCVLKTFRDFRDGHKAMALFGVFASLVALALTGLTIFARYLG